MSRWQRPPSHFPHTIAIPPHHPLLVLVDLPPPHIALPLLLPVAPAAFRSALPPRSSWPRPSEAASWSSARKLRPADLQLQLLQARGGLSSLATRIIVIARALAPSPCPFVCCHHHHLRLCPCGSRALYIFPQLNPCSPTSPASAYASACYSSATAGLPLPMIASWPQTRARTRRRGAHDCL